MHVSPLYLILAIPAVLLRGIQYGWHTWSAKRSLGAREDALQGYQKLLATEKITVGSEQDELVQRSHELYFDDAARANEKAARALEKLVWWRDLVFQYAIVEVPFLEKISHVRVPFMYASRITFRNVLTGLALGALAIYFAPGAVTRSVDVTHEAMVSAVEWGWVGVTQNAPAVARKFIRNALLGAEEATTVVDQGAEKKPEVALDAKKEPGTGVGG